MNKTMLYRQDGYIFVLLYLKNHTIEQLEEEIELREATGIKTILSFDELDADAGLDVMKGYISQAQNVMWCVALRKLGFARKRIRRNLERVRANLPVKVKDIFYRREYLGERLKKILRQRRYDSEPDSDKMPSRTVQEYIREREEGVKYACRYAKENGKPMVRKLVTRNKFNANMVLHENDYANDLIRGMVNEVIILEWLSSLHDLEGYGDKRLNRVMDHFEACYKQVMDRKEGYENYLEEISKVTDEWLPDDYLKEDIKYDKVRHKKKKSRKSKKKSEKPKEPSVALPPIEEPDDYTTYPCMGCAYRQRCRSEGYRTECTCLALYKDVRREHVRQNLNIA